jgi:hypothetical protein
VKRKSFRVPRRAFTKVATTIAQTAVATSAGTPRSGRLQKQNRPYLLRSVADPKSITSVHELLENVEAFAKDKTVEAHLRLWYRGHADESWKLEPGVYRQGFLTKGEATSDAVEKARLQKERRLTQDFRVESPALISAESYSDIYFLQQHYGMPTRLLDWTLSPLAALFFAVCDPKHRNKSGTFFVLDAYKFRGNNDVATQNRPAFVEGMKVIFDWADPKGFPPHILPVRPFMSDVRIIQQRGVFTFHVPNHAVVTEAENPTLMKYCIPADAKEGIERQLRLLRVDEVGIYRDLPSLGLTLKAAYNIS